MVHLASMNPHDERPVTTSGAARLADKSGATILSWERKGLLPCERTASGVRLFRPAAVLRVAQEQAARAKRARSSEAL